MDGKIRRDVDERRNDVAQCHQWNRMYRCLIVRTGCEWRRELVAQVASCSRHGHLYAVS